MPRPMAGQVPRKWLVSPPSPTTVMSRDIGKDRTCSQVWSFCILVGEVGLEADVGRLRSFAALWGDEPERAAGTRPKRLFIKNTGLCEAERRSIGADTCPVLEG